MLDRQTLMIMNRCNLACTYCYYEEGDAHYPAQVVAPDVYDRWLRGCSELTSLEHISFTGGEPTIRPEFADLLSVATAYAKDVTIFTNGVTMTSSLADLLRATGCEVHVSIDHVSPTLDDRVRGGTRATLRGLEVLTSAGVEQVQVVMVLTSRNWTDAETVLDFAAKCGFACELIAVSVPPVHPLSLLSLPTEDRRRLADLIAERRGQLGRTPYYAKLRRFILTGAKPTVVGCDTGDNGIFVNADGDVWVCASRPRPSLGNIADADPRAVLAAKSAAVAAVRPGRCVTMDCLVMTC